MPNNQDPVKQPGDAGASASTAGGPGSGLLLTPGARPVADYELVHQLGRGGFGEVWKALGPGGFDVALKFVRLGDKSSTVELRSLDLMKSIRHSHLLGMFGAWQRDGFLIIAMELGERTLFDRLRQAKEQGTAGIPAAELLEHMRDAARGIDHLNKIGIQHRDIKPQNLLLVGGSIKVADFGLAKLLEHSLTSNSGSMTPAYAAPEFFSGRTSSQSDQYALAVTYCQLRGGWLPFAGNPAQIMAGHLMEPPDLTMLPETERPVLVRALAKKPEERWPNCRAFVEELAKAVADVTPVLTEIARPMSNQETSPPMSGGRGGGKADCIQPPNPQPPPTANGPDKFLVRSAIVLFVGGVVWGAHPLWHGPVPEPSLPGLALVAGFGLVWVGLLAAWAVRLLTTGRCVGWRRAALAPTLAAGLALLLWEAVPLRVTFWLHRPALDRIVEEAKAAPGGELAGPRRVGLYAVTRVVHTPADGDTRVFVDADLALYHIPPFFVKEGRTPCRYGVVALGDGWHWYASAE